jgi:hypothetical protein
MFFRRGDAVNEIKGHRLHVKLGASQVRRRLKGLGFGVRKVESAGRGEALIIHTATGQHLRELQAVFQDVMERDSPEGSSSTLGEDEEATTSRLRPCSEDTSRHQPAL